MFPAYLAFIFGGLALLVGGLSSGGSSSSDDSGSTNGEDGGNPAPPVPDVDDSEHDLDWDGLTAEEQLVVELINRARMDPLREVARLDEELASGISSSPVEPLAVTPELSEASREHSEDMDNRNFFAHTNPSGQSPADRAVEEGHGSRFVGENIGWVGSSQTSFNQQARVEGHHEGLWESDGHQRNLMSESWSEIGVGYDYGSHNGLNGSTFVTEMFSDRGDTYLTGVVIDDHDGDSFYDIGEGLGDVHITAYDGSDLFATATWDAGGYSLALPSGTYQVAFEGGGLDSRFQTEVVIGSQNVKLDVIESGRSSGALVSAALDSSGSEGSGVESDFLPMVPFDESSMEMEEDEEELGFVLV